ncbi:hypothetical protein RHGRI_011217 [Rhododendron griersonianum]|uniref:Uncharacterized protein n=1 Tax=Rhododendron griersonianum TaxID=479676 RepID=A0AAV6KLU0_9ERIC|nr:hypothetical protein RHGRI_011217 [Rhododendron griersonianum]
MPPPATNPEYLPPTEVPAPPVENFEQPFSFPTLDMEIDPELEAAMLDLSHSKLEQQQLGTQLELVLHEIGENSIAAATGLTSAEYGS